MCASLKSFMEFITKLYAISAKLGNSGEEFDNERPKGLPIDRQAIQDE